MTDEERQQILLEILRDVRESRAFAQLSHALRDRIMAATQRACRCGGWRPDCGHGPA